MRKILIISGVVGILLISAAGVWLANGLLPARGTQKEFTIAPGTSRVTIARNLEKEGIIRSANAFLIASVLSGKGMKAGTYLLNPNVTGWQTLQTINHSQEAQVTITIPEGWRREQIAALLTEKGLDGPGFLTLTTDKEGTLFPDTYYVPKQATAQQIVDRFTQNFATRTQELAPDRDTIILASIVEREAKTDAERALISGIYSHRLRIGMRLEADPTVQYARDNQLLAAGPVETFWKPITLANYTNVVSKYNTYLNTGLPPGPIANPGLKSLAAAKNPQATDAIYFFHTADGTIVTSRTLEEHARNKQKYLR